ncbi:MAG: septum formation inhibitor Maf [Clostridiales bacterium]|jgi:septum formation protein|nr:septum formation inhibitor Maf [Clostridiales bacterium]
MMRIILASASPRRKQLLEQMGLKFDVITSNTKEQMPYGLVTEEIPMELAYNKAMDVASGVSQPAIIIGADTVVVKDEILGKPKNEEEACQMLLRLQGQTHEVITGLALVDTWTGKIKKGYEKTLVEMAPLSLQEIEHYVQTGEPMDKAGAYGIQGSAGIFISRITGCYFNVMGLPIHRLWCMLKEFGIDILDNI